MGKYICNPLNFEYRYQIKKSLMGNAVFREAADPTMVLFRDIYYLFASMSGGFWYSEDLSDWRFKETPELPIYDYAPDVREIDGRIIFSASRRGVPCTFFGSTDPLNVPFTPISATFDFWDPDIFQDDDGRVYFYWGCTNTDPIYGLEVDSKTFEPIGEKLALVGENEAEHGWERKGDNNKLSAPINELEKRIREHVGTKPFIEGAYVTKHKGKYYLQYAAPGTECNVYSDGVYVGDNPLGPFVYQEHNPFSSKPGGFITSAGHGSTFRDKFGNWWHISTMRISANERFERRIGLFPCDFDKDGVLFCNQNFADYPFSLPEALRADITGTVPEMQLLSFNKKAEASSSQHGHGPELGVNEDIRSWWAAENPGAGEWFRLDLGRVYSVQAVQINFADHKLPVPDCSDDSMHNESFGQRLIEVKPKCTEYLLEGSADGKNWTPLNDTRNRNSDYAHDFIMLDKPEKLRFLKLSHMKMPFGGVPAVSGLRVFGKGSGKAPAEAENVRATRDSRLNILLSWDASEGADGYNVRYGIAPDKMYNCWQMQNTAELDLSMVNAGSGYYIAVDSFNENGVTTGKVLFVD